VSLLVDVLLLLAFALTALSGLRNGFFRELFSVVGLIAGVVVSMRLTGRVVAELKMPFLQGEAGSAVVFVVLFLLVFALATLIGGLLAMIWEGKSISGSSRVAGLGIGLLRGLLLVIVLASALTLMAPVGSETLGRSRVLPYLSPAVRWGSEVLPDDLSGRLLQQWDALPFDGTTQARRSIEV
jgi:membrane protein required for colicin V production